MDMKFFQDFREFQELREQKWVFDISDQGESSHQATLGLQDQGSSLCCGLFKMPGQTTIYWQDKAYSDGARARTPVKYWETQGRNV